MDISKKNLFHPLMCKSIYNFYVVFFLFDILSFSIKFKLPSELDPALFLKI